MKKAKHRFGSFALFAAALAIAGCNTVRGAGEDIRSVGRVFSHHPEDSRGR